MTEYEVHGRLVGVIETATYEACRAGISPDVIEQAVESARLRAVLDGLQMLSVQAARTRL
jgi:hypothetical protein